MLYICTYVYGIYKVLINEKTKQIHSRSLDLSIDHHSLNYINRLSFTQLSKIFKSLSYRNTLVACIHSDNSRSVSVDRDSDLFNFSFKCLRYVDR